jgi:hypothetical protein
LQADLHHDQRAHGQRQAPGQCVPTLGREQVIQAEAPADDEHADEHRRADTLDDPHHHRRRGRLVAARRLQRSLDHDQAFALEIHAHLFGVAVLQGRTAPRQLGLAGGEGTLNHLELVAAGVDPVGLLDRVETD